MNIMLCLLCNSHKFVQITHDCGAADIYLVREEIRPCPDNKDIFQNIGSDFCLNNCDGVFLHFTFFTNYALLRQVFDTLLPPTGFFWKRRCKYICKNVDRASDQWRESVHWKLMLTSHSALFKLTMYFMAELNGWLPAWKSLWSSVDEERLHWKAVSTGLSTIHCYSST